MSLDTLLEAAHFIEWSHNSSTKARATEATEFHHYAKPAPSPKSQGKNNGGSDKAEKKIKEEDEGKDKRRPYSGAGMREVHNKLEKNRRAHLKECFDMLRAQIPHMDDKKTSNLNILRCALRYIQFVKRQEKELEQELQRLAQAKISSQQRIQQLQEELAAIHVEVDLSKFMPDNDDDAHSVSTATADESPFVSEDENEDEKSPVKHVPMETGPTSAILGLASPGATSKEAVISRPNTVINPTPVHVAVDLKEIKTLAAKKQGVPKPLPSMPRTPVVQSPTVSSVAAVVTSPGPTVPTTTPQSGILPPARQPVTKLLQQTIAERQKQQQKQAEQLRQLQQQQLAGLVAQPQVLTVNSASVRPTVTTLKQANPTITTLRPTTVAFNQLLPSLPAASILTPAAATATVPSSPQVAAAASNNVSAIAVTTVAAIPATMATLSKLVMATGTVPSTTANTPVVSASLALAAATTNSATTFSGVAEPTAGVVVTGTSTPQTAATPLVATASVGGNIKHIITSPLTALPTAQLVSPAQISALQQLMAQGIARPAAPLASLATTNVSMTPILSVSPTVAQSPTTQAAQLVSPMTVISPAGVQVPLASALTHTQVLRTPMGNIPIISPYPLPIKPVVMVSMPSVVAGAAAATVTANTGTVTANVSNSS